MAVFRDWLIVGIYTGNRKSEWDQEHHIGCSGKFAIWDVKRGVDGPSIAFTQKDLVLLEKNGKHLYSIESAQVEGRDAEFLDI
eukprot:14482683-Ditylum_brightwellii.AAC.1